MTYTSQGSTYRRYLYYAKWTPEGPTTGTLSGKVTDASTSNPINEATVSANGYSTSTDSQGNYSFSVPKGTYTVTASASGYESQTKSDIVVTAGATTTLDFSLDPITVSLFQSRRIYIWGFTLSLIDNESDRQRFFNFCEARGIKTIFLWAEELTQGPGKYDKYKDFIAVAHSSGYNMQVHALFGDTTGSWTENHSKVNDRVAAVLNHNSTYPNYKFDCIHLDIEFDPDTYNWDPDVK